MKSSTLLFGGVSEEKLVSTATAQNVVQYLKSPRVVFISPEGKIHEIDPQELIQHKSSYTVLLKPKTVPVAQSLKEYLPRLQNSTVFMALHGTEGEDGGIQSLFEKNNISYTGSDSKCSALCFDKLKAKKKANEQGLKQAKEIVLSRDQGPARKSRLKEFFQECKKIVVKPVANGSSFGLTIVSDTKSLEKALQDFEKHAEIDFMAEEFIHGRELTVGVLQWKGECRPLPASEVLLDSGVSFDYEGKYLGRGSKEITPAQITAQEMQSAQEMALKAHQIFGCSGYSRTDVILTPQGPVFLETNTLPGLTKASFFPQQLEAAAIPFQNFVDEMLNLAEHRQ